MKVLPMPTLTISLSTEALEVLEEIWRGVRHPDREIPQEEWVAIAIERLVDSYDAARPIDFNSTDSEESPITADAISKHIEALMSPTIAYEELTVRDLGVAVSELGRSALTFEDIQRLMPDDPVVKEAGDSQTRRDAITLVFNNVDLEVWQMKGQALVNRAEAMLIEKTP